MRPYFFGDRKDLHPACAARHLFVRTSREHCYARRFWHGHRFYSPEVVLCKVKREGRTEVVCFPKQGLRFMVAKARPGIIGPPTLACRLCQAGRDSEGHTSALCFVFFVLYCYYSRVYNKYNISENNNNHSNYCWYRYYHKHPPRPLPRPRPQSRRRLSLHHVALLCR